MTLYLGPNERALVAGAVHRLNDEGIPYAVLRRYEGLPEFVPGPDEKTVDIDILVHHSRFNDAVQVLRGLGFSSLTLQTRGMWRLVVAGARRPWKALHRVTRSPSASVATVRKALSARANGAEPQAGDPYQQASSGNYRHLMRYGNVSLDLKNHLAHVSPMNGARIRIDPRVEERMLERRESANGFLYKPAPPDELAHLVAHCVFEYKGHFDEYYTGRCAELARQVFDGASGNGRDQQFRELMGLMFYKAGDLAYDRVRKGDLHDLRPALRAFADY